MPTGPDGTVMHESSSDDDTGGAVGSAEKEAEEHGGTKPVSGAGARPRKERRPRSPSPIDELIAAIMRSYPRSCPILEAMDWIHFPMIGPKSKFNSQFLKDYQVKDLMCIC